MALFKKIALIVLIIAAVISLLLVAQIKVATYLFDSKLNSALSRAERVMPGLKLSYTPGANSFTVRQGRLFYEIPLKQGNNLGVTSVTGAVDLKVGFGALRVTGAMDSVPGVGNIEDVLSKFNVEPISFSGAFKARAVTPRLEGTLKTDSFLWPTSTGICKLGQNSLHFLATSKEDVDVKFSSAGVVCEGALRYNNKPNYRLDLLGLDVQFLPRIINQKPHFDSLIVNLKQLDFKFSALYAIGFSPEEQVRDPSLQDAISFNNVSTLVALSQPDDEGMAKLTFSNSGNYGFAFPYIRYNEEQPYYRLDNFKLAGSVERISIPRLFDAAKSVMQNASEQFESKQVIKEFLSGFTDTITCTLNEFGYTHEGQSLSVTGVSNVAFDETSDRPKLRQFDSDYKIKVDKNMLEEMAGENYATPLHNAVAANQITFDGSSYSTDLRIEGKQMFLNGIAVENLVSQDDMLYEEEQQAQAAQRAQEQADAAALQAEIEAAQRAQENLPSMVDGSLNQQNQQNQEPNAGADGAGMNY